MAPNQEQKSYTKGVRDLGSDHGERLKIKGLC
jgi:hypothetical protein